MLFVLFRCNFAKPNCANMFFFCEKLSPINPPKQATLVQSFPVVLSWTLTFIMPTETVESEMRLLDLLQFLWALHRLTLEWIYWDDCVIVLNHAWMLQTDKLLKLLLLQRCSHLTSSYGRGEAVLSFSWLQRLQWKLFFFTTTYAVWIVSAIPTICVIYTLNIYRVSFQDLCSVEILNRIGTSLRAECKFVISI